MKPSPHPISFRSAPACLPAILALVMPTLSSRGNTAEFHDLGELPGGTAYAQAFAVSNDGMVAVGNSISADGLEAFRWNEIEGILPLVPADLPGGAFQTSAWACSADGSFVVGSAYSANGLEAFRWDAALQSMVGLGDLPGGSFSSDARGISADGSTVVGLGTSANGREAFLWNATTGSMAGLGDLTGGTFHSEAHGVSADGRWVVGRGESASGTEATRWDTATSQLTGLGDLAGGSFFSEAFAVSDDGSVVVGRSDSSLGFEAFVWDAASGQMNGLGDFAGGAYSSIAHGVSADGSTVVGTSSASGGNQAFVWTAAKGMRALRDILIDDHGLDPAGWQLSVARGISADGRTIAGYGFNPSGEYAAWLVRLPAPEPESLFIDGRLFVASPLGVVVYEPDGTLVTTIDSLPSPAQAGDVAFHPVRDLLYVTDRQGGEIHLINREGVVVDTIAPPTPPNQLIGIEIDDAGRAYAAGSDGMVHVFSSDGSYDRSMAVPGNPFLLFLALNPDQSELLVTENNYFKGVHRFDLSGGDAYLGAYGDTQANAGLINQVTFAPDGSLYVTDDIFGQGQGTVERYLPDGSFDGILYTGIKAGWGLEVGPDGNIWVGNTNDFSGAPKILVLAPDGTLLNGFGAQADLVQNVGMAFYEARNAAPTAVAGSDQSIRAGDTVFLDGSASFDDNTSSADLDFAWSFDLVPSGSAATLQDADTATPSFIADVAGSFLVRLVVTDEAGLSSNPSVVVVSSGNIAPTAVASASPPVAVLGESVSLDGTASTDPESDPLAYHWSIVSAPAGSSAVLSDPGAAIGTFVPDLAGGYEIELVVSDPLGPGSATTVAVTAVTASSYAELLVREALLILLDLPPDSVATRGNQRALTNFLQQTLAALEAGDTGESVSKLGKAVERTDGFVLRGEADGNGPGRDWVLDAAAQEALYDRLASALAILTAP